MLSMHYLGALCVYLMFVCDSLDSSLFICIQSYSMSSVARTCPHTLPFKTCWDNSKFRRTFTLKALKNMHLILYNQIGQPIITMKFL